MSGGQCIKTKKTLKIISACVLHAWFSRKQLNRKRAWPRTLFRVNATWRDNECARKIINFGTDVWSGTSKKLNLFLFLGKPYSYLLSPTYRSSISTKKWGYVGIIMKINLYFFFPHSIHSTHQSFHNRLKKCRKLRIRKLWIIFRVVVSKFGRDN